jgi:hypothetical protein
VADTAGLKFFGRDDLEIGRRHTPDRAFFVQGYPAAEVNVTQTSSRPVLDLLSMGLGTVSLPPDTDQDELVVEYPPRSPEDTGLELPHPRGISGGGVYVLPPDDRAVVWSPQQSKLVAVAHSFDALHYRLASTPIELWLTMVTEDHPYLRGLLPHLH